MRNYFLTSLPLFLTVTLGALLSRHFGFYNDYWFTDIILHTISGLAFGVLWIGLYKKTHSPFLLLILGAMSFAVLGSVLWEFWEFAGWQLTPAQVPFYIPQLGDTLGDIFCGLVGGSLAAIIAKIKNSN